MWISYLIRVRRGSALAEFAFSSLIMITALMLILEFGVEVFLRQQVERAAGAAASTYAVTASPQNAQDAATSLMLRGFVNCLQAVDIILHDDISSLKNDTGRQAQGDITDDSAHIARVSLSCYWDRLTPPSRLIFGPDMRHTATSYVRIRR